MGGNMSSEGGVFSDFARDILNQSEFARDILNQSDFGKQVLNQYYYTNMGVFYDFGKQARDVLNRYYYKIFPPPNTGVFSDFARDVLNNSEFARDVLNQSEFGKQVLNEYYYNRFPLPNMGVVFSDFGKNARDVLNRYYYKIFPPPNTGVYYKRFPPPPNMGVFSDFGKNARDVLNRYYYNSSSNPNNKEIFFGLGCSSSSHADFLFTAYPHVEEGGFSLGEFSAASSPNFRNKNSIEIKTNAELNGFSTHIVSEIVPRTLNGFMDMKFPDLDGTSKVGIQYLFPPYGTLTAATFTSTTLKDNFSTFQYSGTIGYGQFSMGGDFVISDSNFFNPHVDFEFDVKDYSGGIRYMNSNLDATIGFTDKGDTLSASCVHSLVNHKRRRSCIVAEFRRNLSSNENTLTIGGAMELKMGEKYDMKTTLLKAKVDNHGKMGVVLQQQLFEDTKIRICGEFDHKNFNKTPRIGLSLIL